ncbi:TrbI/VirB10 family protein [Novosphingobium sp. ST904]|uniref:TrbI/VirB10 family protein n=1 Tax=Novosphingobium sp. ST904 TaxID=1684385 RepID=UPI0010488DE6|nr:TrbI/VirB10 family protein [Novosphingobium sp. ST904]TCM22999.1 type IV secretion system protein VirB10 [Novosphingobium sp. ST904]
MTDVAPPEPAKKVDPETLELRTPPRRAIRLRRNVVVGATACASVALLGITWLALKPQVIRKVAQDSELSQPGVNGAPDSLAGLPGSYGDVPKLGPPLPGDLGRPILRAQERVGATAEGNPSRTDEQSARRQQQRSELQAARQSGLLAQVSSGRTANPVLPSPGIAPDASSPLVPQTTRKEQFAGILDTGSTDNTHRLVPLTSPRSILAGSVIPASLITGLNSDLPGMVTAQVTQNIFDTVTGRILLIPQGARLIGKYDSLVAFGQKRALVVWQRLILPNGSSLPLDNMPATDPSGYTGLADKVDFHTWTLLKGVTIATMLGVGSELTITGEGGLVEAIRQSAQTNTARAGDQITQRNLEVQPTITIRPGAPVRVLVTRDLVL